MQTRIKQRINTYLGDFFFQKINFLQTLKFCSIAYVTGQVVQIWTNLQIL